MWYQKDNHNNDNGGNDNIDNNKNCLGVKWVSLQLVFTLELLCVSLRHYHLYD